jgi:hypothetical protein
MPTTRRRRRQALREPLSPALRHWLETGEWSDPAADGFLEMLGLTHRGQRPTLAAWWRAVRNELLRDWIAAHPGRRPHAWWALGDAPEPHRRRLGGVGTPCHEVLAYVPSFKFGIPVYWITAGEVGPASANRAEPFRGRAIDPDDPPRYESQATFLDRHGLLSAAERMALPADAFEPEVILPADDVLDPEDTL